MTKTLRDIGMTLFWLAVIAAAGLLLVTYAGWFVGEVR